ncbi:MAG: hypothetical protein IKY76_00320 [Alistipes sp.]|nr:hypothetical protein [Alistipes sp.]
MKNLFAKIIKHLPRRHFREVKYFSPDGRDMPNGVGFQRGNFIKSCADNARNFTLSPASHSANSRVGVIVFPSNILSIDCGAITHHLATCKSPTHTLGNAFRGRYVNPNGAIYDSTSITIELHNLSTRSLLRLANHLSRTLNQPSILVKDFAGNKLVLTINDAMK